MDMTTHRNRDISSAEVPENPSASPGSSSASGSSRSRSSSAAAGSSSAAALEKSSGAKPAPEKVSRARKTSTAPTRIWKFYARIHPEDEQQVFDLLRKGRAYYNALVEIERSRRTVFAAIRRQHSPEFADLEDRYASLNEKDLEYYRLTKAARQEHFSKTKGDKVRLLVPELEAARAANKVEMKAVLAALKPLREQLKEELTPAQVAYRERATLLACGGGPTVKGKANATVLAEMLEEPEWSLLWKTVARSDAETHAKMVAARHECGLPSGTYLQVEEAFQRAKADSLPAPPKFKRFDGSGKLALQLKGMEAGKLAWGPAPAVEGRRQGKNPIYAFTMKQDIPRGPRVQIRGTTKVHRVPPKDAAVKWVSLIARRSGSSPTCAVGFEIQLTLEHSSFGRETRPIGTAPAEHVRIGWSELERGADEVGEAPRSGERSAKERGAELRADEVGEATRQSRSPLEWAEPAKRRGSLVPTRQSRSAATAGTGRNDPSAWKKNPPPIRIACWPGGEVVVPSYLLGQHDQAAHLRSVRDTLFNRAVSFLRRWTALGGSPMTGWHFIKSDARRADLRRQCMAYARYVLEVGCQNVYGEVHDCWKAWLSERKAAGLDLYEHARVVVAWFRKRNPSASTTAGTAFWLYVWARKDEHLETYARTAGRRFERRRDALFKAEAIRLATQFESLTIDNYRISDMKELPLLTMPGEGVRDTAQHNAQAAAPGTFREILLETMCGRCVATARAAPAATTA